MSAKESSESIGDKFLTEAVKKYAISEGADLVGIAPVSRYEGAPRMLRPQAHMPEAKAVIVMAVHHPDGSVDFGAEPNSNYTAGFQIGMIPKLDTMALRVARFVQRQGHAAVPYSCTYFWRHRKYKDTGFDHAASFSHMTAFVAAGLGEFGWHGMAMSPQYGPRQRIISVFTAAPLVPDPLYSGEPLCDQCGQCEKACWGVNYKPEHLLEPKTISFMMEDKKIEYANVNRWRCFWGEQCHLDMNHLAERSNLGEKEIYEAMDSGVKRTGVGGYMCSSFKYCMAKPLRRWDKKHTPNPRRKKASIKLTAAELREIIAEKAKEAGADRCAIQPMKLFEGLKSGFYEGFRGDDLFKSFQWVVTLSREVPVCGPQNNPLYKKNVSVLSMTRGRLMSGVLDIARRIDDSGYEATQMWGSSGFAPKAAELAGWTAKENTELVLESLIVSAPLAEEIINIPTEHSDIRPEDIIPSALTRFPHIDLIGAAEMESFEFPAGKELRKLIPEGKTLIAVGAELMDRVVELAGKQEAECAVSWQHSHYQGQREVFWAAQEIASALRARGHFALPLIDLETTEDAKISYGIKLPNLQAQAPFAAAAGLGAVGKSGLLITPQFGPRQRLAFVVTDAELPETKENSPGESPCPAGCSACAESCPGKALEPKETETLTVTKDKAYPVFKRSSARCEWSCVMGMTVSGETDLSGWRVPKLPIPDKLDDKTRKNALEQKDPILRLCYGHPTARDTQVENCLRDCPLCKTGRQS
jgi:epoxyqueuosine reductase QueG